MTNKLRGYYLNDYKLELTPEFTRSDNVARASDSLVNQRRVGRVNNKLYCNFNCSLSPCVISRTKN